jgi:hypothetical protein
MENFSYPLAPAIKNLYSSPKILPFCPSKKTRNDPGQEAEQDPTPFGNKGLVIFLSTPAAKPFAS